MPTLAVRARSLLIRQFEVTVVDGPGRGTRVQSQGDELSIGTSEGNDLRLADPAVSRHHCALRATERGLELRDLGSRNGTFVGEVELSAGFVRSGAQLRIGTTTIALRVLDHDLEQPLAADSQLGPILGASVAMRRLYPMIETCGRSTATVLIHGETGTGKELIAEAIHDASDRRHQPFIVIDCSALSHDLAESELFGHERGAFTGAETRRIGAFESAHGGTIFLDEIGELPLALQPLLLRALENRTIRRVGGNEQRAVDVRVVAASHRELRSLVNDKRFRADLFYRLNVIRIAVPPLRERAGDVEVLAAHFWSTFRPDQALPPALLEHLAAQSWPGNVRELRNAVERAALLGFSPAAAEARVAAAEPHSYQDAKERAVIAWERTWIVELVRAHDGNLSRAARAAKMGRSHLRELARRHGVAAPAAGEHDDAD
ncbi:MAG TPA: sigma 54-interacting transcriptional regulator [Kofleriaceae bacterium]|jgi:transcriptional regulator with GAF, ATPase, and Fis domain|nr:sigma 54-interacting transcriptional regulator [Kofleriaceae bacterium]